MFEFDKVAAAARERTWPAVTFGAQVLGARAREEEVFACLQPLMVSVLDGRHVCIFAYGQTGRCAAAHRVWPCGARDA